MVDRDGLVKAQEHITKVTTTITMPMLVEDILTDILQLKRRLHMATHMEEEAMRLARIDIPPPLPLLQVMLQHMDIPSNITTQLPIITPAPMLNRPPLPLPTQLHRDIICQPFPQHLLTMPLSIAPLHP